MDQSPTLDRAARGKHRKKKGNGMIKLLNGMPLSLDDEPVDVHCDLLKGRSKERALEHQNMIQKHYNDITNLSMFLMKTWKPAFETLQTDMVS